ncbi:apoptosis-inducing factor 2, partial [Phenoliferia sp. Uapishka_3]
MDSEAEAHKGKTKVQSGCEDGARQLINLPALSPGSRAYGRLLRHNPELRPLILLRNLDQQISSALSTPPTSTFNQSSPPRTMSELKNVILVGLGPAGITAAKSLASSLPATHRLIAINQEEFGFWPIASLRAAVVPGWEDKTTLSVDGIFGKGSRHVVLGGTKVVGVGEGGRSVKVDVEHTTAGFGLEIEADYIVFATGATYAWPARPPTGSRDIQAVVDAYKILQSEVAQAESVLVVGAGATGVEYAGEVKHQFPDKKVTLVASSAQLFDGPQWNPKFGKSLQSQLEEMNVDIKYGTRLDTGDLKTGPISRQEFSFTDGSSVQGKLSCHPQSMIILPIKEPSLLTTFLHIVHTADYLMLATGIKPNSEVISQFDPSTVDASGAVKVLPTFQLVDEAYSHIFAIGDVTDRPESKQAATAGNHIPILVANILAMIKGAKPTKEHKVGGPMILVTCGPEGGAAQLFGWVVGAWMAKRAKSRSLFVPMFKANYPALVQ